MSPSLQPLLASAVVVSYGGRTVLRSVDFRATPGQRVGLVGENGSGKSTLLRVLSGEQQPDHGSMVRPVDLVHLPQDPVFPLGATVGEVLDQALRPLHEAVRAVEVLGAALARGGAEQPYADALEWAEDHDAWARTCAPSSPRSAWASPGWTARATSTRCPADSAVGSPSRRR